MSISEAKEMYLSMLESGDLENFLPKASGSWDKDMNEFLRHYTESERLIEDIEFFDLDEEY